MYPDRRTLAAFAGWGSLLIVPLLILFWLLANPAVNPTFDIPVHHVYIVGAAHIVSLALALLVVRTAISIGEFRVLFLSLGFMAISGFFVVHAIATPGVFLPAFDDYDGSVAGLSAFLSLFAASVFFTCSVSANPLGARYAARGMSMSLVGTTLLVILAFAVVSFTWPEDLGELPVTVPVGSYLVAGLTIALLAFAAWRYLSAYSVARLPMQGAMVLGLVLLMEAQLSMAIAPTWTLAWWEYHFLMLLGSSAAMAGLLIQYNKAGSLRNIMEAVFGIQSLVQIQLAHTDAIAALAAATEAKDPYTKGHTIRVAESAVILGKALSLPNDKLRTLARAGLLHDIGKLGIPDTILLKPGPLTDEEFAVIKLHPDLGLEIVSRVGSLEQEIAVIRGHHEKLDGSGYPLGLSGGQIPIETRVLTVADVYDSLVSDRPYRKRLPLGRVKAILQEEAVSQLDPRVVNVCLKLVEQGDLPGSIVRADANVGAS